MEAEKERRAASLAQAAAARDQGDAARVQAQLVNQMREAADKNALYKANRRWVDLPAAHWGQ